MIPQPGRRALAWLVAAACAGAGAWLSAQHPLSAVLALSAWGLWLWVAWRWPRAWLFVVPAALPLASLMLWTGWVARSEFDLLLLGALAAGHARLARDGLPLPADPAEQRRWRRLDGLAALLWLGLALGLLLAWADAPRPQRFDAGPFTGFANSLRVAKGMACALLFLPLVRAALLQAPRAATQRLAAGMCTGLGVLSLAVLWERAALPGLLNFSSDYRTVGLFWEMHVGGAAIDAYLAVAVPFAVWAVASARRFRNWLLAALLLQLLAYVCLTTFARGVYGAVLGGLVVAALLWSWRVRPVAPQAAAWRMRANVVLWVLLVLQVAAMAVASSFMVERLQASDKDFGSRLAHWSRGLSIAQAPRDWLLGIGLGRLPERYASQGTAGEFPGAARLLAEPAPGSDGRLDDRLDGHVDGHRDGHFLRLYGPPTRLQLAGRYGMAQQVEVVPDARYRLAFDLRAARGAYLRVRICERHLLYELDCQQRYMARRAGTGGRWEHVVVDLRGPALSRGETWAPRLVSLDVSVLMPGTAVDVDNLQLSAGARSGLLANGDFEGGLAYWYPTIDGYFLPWHIDNLYLELLIERGVAGLLLVGVLVGTALWRSTFGAARHQRAAPWLAAALASGCALGMVSSIMDMPRVAFVFLLLAWCALHLPPAARAGRSDGRRTGL